MSFRASASLALLSCWLLACAAKDPAPRAPSSSAPAGGSGCSTYSPPVCMAGQVRCVTDANGCETCTCDEQQPPGPGER